jgi:CheY-like chemotaxis protein
MSSEVSVVHVDDDPGIVELTEAYLERHSDQLTVTPVTSVSAAIECVSDETDCVISDYEMPEMDGIELLGVIREAYPDLPCILFTENRGESLAL